MACAAISLTACGREDASGDDASTADTAAAPTEKAIDPVPGNPPKELVIRDIRDGTGRRVGIGDRVAIKFDMVRFAPREHVDSNRLGEPRRFKLGAGDEIPGWERGLPGMRVGGRRKLIVPPRLIYSNSGPEDTMVYVIDLVGTR